VSGANATLNLRAATAEDLDTYFLLFSEVQALHVAERPDLFQPAEKSQAFQRHFNDAVAQPHKEIVIAWLGDDPVGAVHYEVTSLDPTGVYLIDRPMLWIESIAVLPHLRRKGIASALIGLVRQVAAQKGIADLGLEVWSFNEGAAKAFEAAGLKVHATTMLGRV
jgi:GNAT superfamily N-acetyltransferase